MKPVTTIRFGKTSLKANVYLSDAKLKVYTVLRAYQGNQETCFPSLSAIREDLAYYDEVRGKVVKKYLYSIGYISKIIGKLKSDGWVILVRKGGYGRSNEYKVLDCSPNVIRFETEYSFPKSASQENHGFPSMEANSSFPSMEANHKQDHIKEHRKDHEKEVFRIEIERREKIDNLLRCIEDQKADPENEYWVWGIDDLEQQLKELGYRPMQYA